MLQGGVVSYFYSTPNSSEFYPSRFPDVLEMQFSIQTGVAASSAYSVKDPADPHALEAPGRRLTL